MNFSAILELAWTNVLLAGTSALVVFIVFWIAERLSPFDECVRKSDDALACSIYGGLRIVAWAIMFAACIR